MEIKVNAIDLIKILSDIHNLFNDLTPTLFQKHIKGESEDERLLVRQQIIKERIIQMLEAGLEYNVDLYKGPTPFKWNAEAICKRLNIKKPDRRKL